MFTILCLRLPISNLCSPMSNTTNDAECWPTNSNWSLKICIVFSYWIFKGNIEIRLRLEIHQSLVSSSSQLGLSIFRLKTLAPSFPEYNQFRLFWFINLFIYLFFVKYPLFSYFNFEIGPTINLIIFIGFCFSSSFFNSFFVKDALFS